MGTAEARETLERYTASSTFPTLSTEELDALLASAAINPDRWGIYDVTDDMYVGTTTVWSADTDYVVGDLIVPTSRNGHTYQVTTGGDSGPTEPIWPVDGGSVVQGPTYLDIGTAYAWAPTYDLWKAAADGWELKAGKVTDRAQFGADGASYNPQQVMEHCLKMAEVYRNKWSGTIPLRPPGTGTDDLDMLTRLPRA